ncbi:high mobility group protein DSP1 isoform X2 [Dermacentor silvarum]|uniref:high mobility group protein DSP1 isoform X2 n=1 Tax=Dermacentor silvarum TaxID=543639 RepID=UPI0018974340|nr:high mobility group protein DSP1 isoform X2 [Dermacentor silvarum]
MRHPFKAGSRGKYFGQQLDDWRQNSELYSKKADYDYHHAMAQHAAVVSAAGGGQLHPAMAQLPMLPTGLNLSMGSAANMAANMAAAAGLQMSQLTASANSTSSSASSGGGGGGGGGSAAALHHHHHHHHQHIQHQHGNAPAAHQQAAAALHHQHQHHHHVGYMGHMGAGAGVVGPGGKLKHKKPKVNKDGVPAPKRATTAYITFTQWYREEMKKSGRQIPRIGDFGKECAGKWNTMSDEDKQPFLSAAARDRERYKREMAVYKPARDVNKPKRPGTAFMLFMGDFRKEMAGKEPEGGVAALAKLGGERWRGMSEEDKRPYVERQNEEKIKYEQNMEDYRRKQTAESQAAKLQQQQQQAAAAAAAAAAQGDDQGGGTRDQQQQQQHDNGGDSESGEDTFHGNQSHSNPPSGGSTPSPGGGGATTHSEHTDESQQGAAPPTSSAGGSATASERGGSNAGGLPSLASPLSLAHPLASLGYQHSLASFGITSGGFGGSAHAAHVAASTAASAYLPGNAATYSQAHLPGPYSWT